MILLFGTIFMGHIIHIPASVLPKGDTETTLQNNVKHYLRRGQGI